MEVNGTLIWYYNICKREVWLMSRNIVPDQGDENIDYGRFLHEHTYRRNKKEILFGNVKFDVLLHNKEELVIGETKKSSTYEEASKWQLLYYLKVLDETGISARGQLLYPEERKRVDVELTTETKARLEEITRQIQEIMDAEYPPKIEKCRFCAKCGYNEYCFA